MDLRRHFGDRIKPYVLRFRDDLAQDRQVSDAGLVYLRRLTALKMLNLEGSNVSDAGIAYLQRVLPNCRIEK